VLDGYLQDYSGVRLRDDIVSSAVEDGDFARYEIDPLVGNFLLLPREDAGRSAKEIFDDWCIRTIAPFPERDAILTRIVDAMLLLQSLPNRFDLLSRSGEKTKKVGATYAAAASERDAAMHDLEKLLSGEELQQYRIRAEDYIRHPHYYSQKQDSRNARRWVAWRAHELGWTTERFANFDRQHASHG